MGKKAGERGGGQGGTYAIQIITGCSLRGGRERKCIEVSQRLCIFGFQIAPCTDGKDVKILRWIETFIKALSFHRNCLGLCNPSLAFSPRPFHALLFVRCFLFCIRAKAVPIATSPEPRDRSTTQFNAIRASICTGQIGFVLKRELPELWSTGSLGISSRSRN